MAESDAERDLDDRVKAVLHYWRGKRKGALLPSRPDIDPAEIKHLLPNLFLADVIDDGKDFRFRLAGGHLNELIGAELTGQLSSAFQTIPLCREHSLGCREAMQRAAPVFAVWRTVLEDHSAVIWQSVFLPLASDGRNPDIIFGLCCIQTGNALRVQSFKTIAANMTDFSGQWRVLE